MFQPARLKRAMVASCRLPLGMPSLSLLATSYLFLVVGFQVSFLIGGCGCDRFGEAADRTLVAHQPIAFNHDAEQQRVIVAVGCGGDNTQAVAAGLALHPELLAGGAPEGKKAALQGLGIA